MNYFTIKDIENLSGIKAHTLRIWEKRYGIITPKRKASKHRFFDNDDLKQVLRITHLYNNGYKISAIAAMKTNGLNAYETKTALAEDSLIKILIEATIDLDEILLHTTLQKAITAFGLEECMVKVVYPYFEKIGMLWMNNEALPAQERFASNIIVKKLINEIDKLPLSFKSTQPVLILFTPLQEYHEIPLLFMYYMFKKNNRNICYLGTNTNFEVLDAFIRLNKKCILYFHVITNLTHNSIDDYVQQLLQRYNDQKIVMSGKLTNAVTVKSENLKLLHSLDEMVAFGRSVTH